MEIIKHGQIVDDAWVHVADDAPVPAAGDVIVTLKRLQAEGDALRARSGKLGVRLPAEVELGETFPALAGAALLAIEFPKYTDGRGYSTARLLRERYGFKGELRAVGDVLRDQLLYMKRCGIDSFELKAGKDIKGALEAFKELTVNYQGAADDPRPLFRRRP